MGLAEALTQGSGNFPRHYCLGLIEAMQPHQQRVVEEKIFRGIIASASLKQELIEARIRRTRIFRGIIASASLKLDGLDQGFRGHPAFSEALLPRPH